MQRGKAVGVVLDFWKIFFGKRAETRSFLRWEIEGVGGGWPNVWRQLWQGGRGGVQGL